MNTLRASALMLLMVMVANVWSQDGLESERIGAFRQQRTLELDAEDAACLSKFAVTDCQSKVGTRRRQMLAELKRQEGALKAAERLAKGSDKLQKSEDKVVESAKHEGNSPSDIEKRSESEREQARTGKVLIHRNQAKVVGSKSPDRKSTSTLDAATVEKNLAAYQYKLRELDKRRQERDKRLKDNGSGSLPLPTSP